MSKQTKSGKEVKSLTFQMVLFFLLPSVLLPAILSNFVDFGLDKGFLNVLMILGVIGIVLTLIGSFLLALNAFGLKMVNQKTYKISYNEALQQYNTATATSYQNKSNSRLFAIFAIICVPIVSLFGWLFFILYLRDKFFLKLKVLARYTDYANDLIATNSTDFEQLCVAFQQMINCLDLYKASGDRGAGKKMLERADKLLKLMVNANVPATVHSDVIDMVEYAENVEAKKYETEFLGGMKELGKDLYNIFIVPIIDADIGNPTASAKPATEEKECGKGHVEKRDGDYYIVFSDSSKKDIKLRYYSDYSGDAEDYDGNTYKIKSK